MPDVHARFSPSASDRLIHCPPSLLLGEEVGIPDTGSDFAREGTEAHSLCEYLLRTALGEKIEDPRPGFHYYSPEMLECAEGYRDEVLAIYEPLREAGALISVEQQLDLSDFVEGAFGTSDCVIVGEGHLFVIDYKHGKGVPVSAEGDGSGNSQLKCYALGAYQAFSPLYEIDDITLVIYQPRISNYSRYTLSPEALLSWARNVLMPSAEMALHGEGDFSSGPWCRWCKAKTVCRKRAEENLALARYDFARPDTLEDDEVNVILAKLDGLISWANDIKEYALQRALAGYAWDDWKVVEGRSTRRYTDENAVAKAVEEQGLSPYKQSLLTITEMEKMLGKKRFRELLGGFITKPEGKPTLVSRADTRPEMSNTAIADFS